MINIGCSIKEQGLECSREVSCIAKNGSMSHVNIAFEADGQGIIVDPTIQFVTGCQQAMEVHNGKQDIYIYIYIYIYGGEG